MTNLEWLQHLSEEDPHELAVWFAEEHVDVGLVMSVYRVYKSECKKMRKQLDAIAKVLVG